MPRTYLTSQAKLNNCRYLNEGGYAVCAECGRRYSDRLLNTGDGVKLCPHCVYELNVEQTGIYMELEESADWEGLRDYLMPMGEGLSRRRLFVQDFLTTFEDVEAQRPWDVFNIDEDEEEPPFIYY